MHGGSDVMGVREDIRKVSESGTEVDKDLEEWAKHRRALHNITVRTMIKTVGMQMDLVISTLLYPAVTDQEKADRLDNIRELSTTLADLAEKLKEEVGKL